MIDILIPIGIFGTFLIFTLCVWLIKREKDKEKRARQLQKQSEKSQSQD
jgi:phosphotransferase system  glucose/maltose/N-acetylglucosamine-specific IIC component